VKLYSCYDVTAKEYLPPFEAAHDTAAIRSTVELLSRNPESNRFVRHRRDYTLCRVADFDIETGTFDQVVPSTITTLSALYDAHFSGGQNVQA